MMKYLFTFPDYESSGAKVVDKNAAFQSDIVLKVRAPTPNETGLFRDQVWPISFAKLIYWILSNKASWLLLGWFWPLFNKSIIFGVSWDKVLKIGFCLKLNHHREIKLAQICETLCK